MRRKTLWLLPALALLAAPAALAQEQGSAAPSAVSAVSADAEEELDALTDEFNEARQDFMTRYRAATPEEQQAMAPKFPLLAEPFGARFLALAKKYPGSDEAVQALNWVIANATQAELKDAGLELLLTDFADNPGALSGALRQMLFPGEAGSSEVVRKFLALEQISAESHLEPRALATYALAVQLGADAGRATDEEAKLALSAEAEGLLEACIKFDKTELFPDYKTVAVAAEGQLFEQRQLQIGMIAPDIQGEDIDGVNFKLSDYRGKVVLLDFWGHW